MPWSATATTVRAIGVRISDLFPGGSNQTSGPSRESEGGGHLGDGRDGGIYL